MERLDEGHGGGTRGKIVALRALEAQHGGRHRDEAPEVTRAREEGENLLTAWRLTYDLAPTDPRWLEATEEEILHDLLVRRFHHEHFRRLLNPEEAFVEDAARDPEMPARMEAIKRRVMQDPGTVRALQKLGIGAKQTVKAAPAELRVAIRPGPTDAAKPRKVRP